MENLKQVSFDSPNSWELGYESAIHCELIPNPPQADAETIVRLTHSNVYGPIDDVVFFVRVGDVENPTAFGDLDAASDWKPMQLIEEIVHVDGQDMYRADLPQAVDPREEMPWSGTFETGLSFPSGKNRIEIKVVSSGPLQSGVISDWRINVA